MKLARIPVASALLVGLAALGLVITQAPRQTAAQEYADAASYNRGITTFLFDHRDRLTERDVAVYGVSGMSPFSLTSGAWLTRRLGAPSRWHVHVARADLFYPLGTQPRSIISVRPESSACVERSAAIHIVFDSDGRGRFARDCQAAVEGAHPLPAVEAWQPTRVTPQRAATGFPIAIAGSDFGNAVTLLVEGRPVSAAQARRGRLMTATVPPNAASGSAIDFTVEHRGRAVFQGRIDVGPDPEDKTPGDTGGSGSTEPRRAVRP